MLWSILLRLRQLAFDNGPKPSIDNDNKLKSQRKNPKIQQQWKYLHKNNSFPLTDHLNLVKHKVQVLKHFTRRYWFIVLPLHGVLTLSYTSVFYLLSRKHNLLETLKNYDIYDIDLDTIQAKYLPKLSKSTLQDVAITVILLKISSPLRYATSFFASKAMVNTLRRNHIIQLLPMAKAVKKE